MHAQKNTKKNTQAFFLQLLEKTFLPLQTKYIKATFYAL